MARVHHVHVVETVGKVTIQVRGKSSCHVSELRTLATLLGEVMNDLAIEGEYTVIPQRQTLPGSAAQKGLSIDGTNHNVVGIAFQPGGNATRARYNLHVSDAQEMFRKLKDYIGTSYNGKEKTKGDKVPVEEPGDSSGPDGTNVTEASSSPSGANDVDDNIFFTNDATKMEIFMISLLVAADSNPEKLVSKDQVLSLIVEQAGLSTRFRTGPILKSLKDRGYLVESKEGSEQYRVVAEPASDFHRAHSHKRKKSVKQKLPVAPAKTVSKQSKPGRQKYLSDEEWMRSFVSDLSMLVKESKGSISKKDLLSFIGGRLVDNTSAGTVYGILEGLVRREHIVANGTEGYRVTYRPPADIVEKTVPKIEQARKDASKVFEGFAPFRLPKAFEGMFDNLSILDRLLSHFSSGEVSTAMTVKAIAKDYAGLSEPTYQKLVGHLCGRGYLIKVRHGYYALGPEGYMRLGLPLPKAMMPVSVEKPAAQLTTDMVKREVASPEPPLSDEKPLQGFLATKSEDVSVEVLAGLAKLATEGRDVSALIAQAKDRIAEKQARKDAALATIAKKPNIDTLVTARPLAEIDRL